jgi:hypothetical protein
MYFGPMRDEVRGKWRKLHNAELNNMYSSPNNIREIVSIIMRWAGYVARMGDRRGVYWVSMGRRDGKNHLEEIGVDERIILRWIFRKWDGGTEWIDLA